MPSLSAKTSSAKVFVQPPPPPSAVLIDAIRALIREELKRPGPPGAEEQQPTWHDGFWLLILLVNIVLLVGLVPEQWWKHPALEVPGKLLPWLGGGTFVLGASWFRHRLLAFSGSWAIKIVLVCILLPLLLLHVPFISLQPKINPADLPFYVDGLQSSKKDFRGQTAIWLRLASHTFKIHDTTNTNEREIRWGWRHLLAVWWHGPQPHWALTYPVLIVSDGAGCKVRIKEVNKEEIDSDFFELKRISSFLEFEPNNTSEKIKLPSGTYEFSLDKHGCETLNFPKPVTIPSGEIVDFGEVTCSKK